MPLITNYNVPIFRGTDIVNKKQVSLPNSDEKIKPINNLQTDVVEISGKSKSNAKSKLSKTEKIALGVGGVLTGVVAFAVAFKKHQVNKLSKLYKEKMQFVNLPEKIDFKEAKTLEEGIKFAKEVLKIGEVDNNFTLDAINYANKGLVDVSNANKGHLFMPKKIGCKTLDNAMAYVINDINSPNFGQLVVNKKFFKDADLNNEINKWLGASKPKNTSKASPNSSPKPAKKTEFRPECRLDDRIKGLLKKFQTDQNSLTISEKRDLYYTLCNAGNVQTSVLSLAPLSSLKNNLKTFENNGIKVDVDSFAKLSTKEQSKKLNEYFLEIQNKGIKLVLKIPYLKPEKTIYHEMGHLQDFAKNLKNMDIKHFEFPSWKEFWNSSKNVDIRHVDNRWGGLTYKGYKGKFENEPEKFKKQYPDLYEFLTNQDYQQSAGKVSSYAQTSIGEFIAETYAKMVRGEKIPDDVMTLYNKYNGPKLG